MIKAFESARWVIFTVILSALMVACGGGGSGNDSINAVTGITISPATRSYDPGQEQQLTAQINREDGTQQSFTTQVNWSSSNTSIATVDSGLFVAIGPGTVDISVTVDGTTETQSFTVVDQVERLELRRDNVAVNSTPRDIAAGSTDQLKAFAILASGQTQDVTSQSTWSSSPSSKVSVDQTGEVTGVERTTSPATVAASYTDNGRTFSATARYTVSATLQSIRVTPNPASVPAGVEQQFVAKGTFSDGAEEDLTGVAWSLSETSSSTITLGATSGIAKSNVEGDTGAVIAKKTNSEGTVITSSGSSNGALTITAPLITAVSVNAPNATLPANRDDQFTATGTFSNGDTGDVTDQVTWSSSANNVAVVDNGANKGLVSGIANGEATITATASNPAGSDPASPEGSFTVTVTDADPISITLKIVRGDTLTRVAVGFDLQFQAIGRFPDGSTRDVSNEVTWFTSVAANIATIDQSGRLTAEGVTTAGSPENVAVQAQVDANSVGDSLNITVEDVTLFEIVVEPADSQLPIGESLEYSATGSFTSDTVIPGTTPTTAFSMDFTDQVTWSAVQPAPATGAATEASIDQQGNATGIEAGDVQIQADCSTAATPQTECNNSTGQRISGNTGLEVTDVVVRDLFLSTVTTDTGPVCQTPAPDMTDATTEPQCFGKVARGLTIQVRARAVFSDGTVNNNYETSQNITFNSVNADGSPCALATISNANDTRGRITGNELGTCEITAVATNPSTDEDDQEVADRNLKIEITDEVLQQICIEPVATGNNCTTNDSVDTERAAGVNVPYRARGTFSKGAPRLLSSADMVSWSANPANGVVDVTANGTVRGLTEGVGMTAQITATAQSADGSAITSGPSDFEVTAATLQSVAVTPDTVTLPANTGDQLTATATFTDGTTADVTSSGSTNWVSNDSSAVTVSNASGAQGRIFAAGASGDIATITATYQLGTGTPQSGSSTVMVADGLVTAITVTADNTSIAVGSSQQYTATAQRSDGSSDDISDQVTWSIVASGDGGAATISATGNATGTTAGSVRVFARFTRSDSQTVSGNTVLTITAD